MSREYLVASWREQPRRYKLVGYMGNDGQLHTGEPHPHYIEPKDKVATKEQNIELEDIKNSAILISSEAL